MARDKFDEGKAFLQLDPGCAIELVDGETGRDRAVVANCTADGVEKL